MWVTLTYKNWKNRTVSHTTYITKKSQLREIAKRYEINAEDITHFRTDEKEYSLEEVRRWIS